MEQSIGQRVAQALPLGTPHKEIAAQVGMTEDAFSRAVNGHRGFSPSELARLGEVLQRDIYELITGRPDPSKLVLSARHTYDPITHRRSVENTESDQEIMDAVGVAYRQAATVVTPSPSLIPSNVADARSRLGEGFVRRFITRLSRLEIDVVRIEGLHSSYSTIINGRAVIGIGTSGNWFFENFGIAHELGHLALGHSNVIASNEKSVDEEEVAANAFAAELLLPSESLSAYNWQTMNPNSLAALIWDAGVSTEALRNRLQNLCISTSESNNKLLEKKTQGLLRHHWKPTEPGDPITTRMTEAATRSFPAWLKDAHLDGIAKGKLHKGTLAWMLGVEPQELDVEEPTTQPLSVDELSAILG